MINTIAVFLWFLPMLSFISWQLIKFIVLGIVIVSMSSSRRRKEWGYPFDVGSHVCWECICIWRTDSRRNLCGKWSCKHFLCSQDILFHWSWCTCSYCSHPLKIPLLEDSKRWQLRWEGRPPPPQRPLYFLCCSFWWIWIRWEENVEYLNRGIRFSFLTTQFDE